MSRLSAAALSLTVLFAATAPAGEEAPPGPLARGNWSDAQAGAAKAPLVAVGKVADAGKVEGKSWNMQARGDNVLAPVDVQQELVVEVSEVLRGKLAPGKLTVRVKTVNYPLQSLYQMLNKFDGKRWTNRQVIPAADFALAKDRSFLLFLSEAKAEKGKEKDAPERLAAEHVADASPMEGPDAQLLASARAFCQALADWAQPPKLAPEEDAGLKALAADLGADDFDKREKAEAEFRKVGARAKNYLEAAARDKDPERSFRAKELLKAVEPRPGEVELPKGAGAAGSKPGTMKERPKPKPEGEGEPAPEPAPGPRGAPVLPPLVPNG